MNLATRFSCTAFTFALLGSYASTMLGAEIAYPAQSVRVVVATAAGGGTDTTARILSSKLSDATGHTWVVDNRSGAAGNVGAEIVSRATPDGYTVLVSTSTLLTVNPSLYRMSFSVEKDLQPITTLAISDQILVVNPAVPAKTLKEFIALDKQKPRALNFGSAGVGSSTHLGAELLKKRAGMTMVHVPYKGGGPAAAAVLAGEVHFLVGSIAATTAHISAGRLRALATTGAHRSKLTPELPTVAESGYPGFESGVWFALSAPAGTHKLISERIRNEILKALQLPDVQAALIRQDLNPMPSTPAELASRIKRETAVWADIVKDAGIRVE